MGSIGLECQDLDQETLDEAGNYRVMYELYE